MESSVRVTGVLTTARLRGVVLLAGICLVAVAMAVAGAIAAERSPGIALARALMVGVPAGVGLWVWASRREQRFGLLLVAAGGGWFLTTLAESPDSAVYTAGRVAGWLVEVLLVYLFLAFPDGALRARVDRLLVVAVAVVVAVSLGPQLPVTERFEVPSPYASCVAECPPNALFAVDRQPAFVDVLRPVAVVLLVVVLAAVVLRLLQRTRAATPTSRLILAPVLAVAAVRVGLLGVLLVGREVDPTAWPVHVVAWMLALAVPLVAVAFLAGLLRWKLFAGRALQQLADCVRVLPSTPTLRRAFADALDDSTVAIVFPSERTASGWVDERGQPVAPPPPREGRCLTEVHDGRAVVAGIVHDRALRDDPQLLDATVAMAGVVLENKRLAATAAEAMAQVRESRARIAATAERERRRIERDLHDGAQQRLVALRIELGLAGDLVREDPQLGVARLGELAHAVDDALEELRALAHGVYPALLSSSGIAEALAAVADELPLPVQLRDGQLRRHAPEVESAVYFCVVEALQNVLKHAGPVRRVVVALGYDDAGALTFGVGDDGRGLQPGRTVAGAGMTNMRDRLAAVGGEVEIAAGSGCGVEVRGRIASPPTRDGGAA